MTQFYYPIIVVGAGAAGCMAAISSASYKGLCEPGHVPVLVLEKNRRIADKIYATGNGRCNIANDCMSEDCYYTDSRRDPLSLLKQFGRDDLRTCFEDGGVFWHDRSGYYYPRTDQAGTVARFFERAFERSGIACKLDTQVTAIRAPGDDGLFHIDTTSASYQALAVVCAPGGCSGIKNSKKGANGMSTPFALIRPFHKVRTPVPALVPLLTDDPLIRTAAGVRCDALITIFVGGSEIRSERGELQITEQGISGIPVFQLSRIAARALSSGSDVQCRIDFLPEFSDAEWERELQRRSLAIRDSDTLLDLFEGLVHTRVASYCIRSAGFADEKKIANLDPSSAREVPASLLRSLRARTFRIIGTAGFEKSQVTAGGVDLNDIDDRMMSRRVPGLFMAGEILDADGICGGYNLTMAMCTGYTAGLYAAQYAMESC